MKTISALFVYMLTYGLAMHATASTQDCIGIKLDKRRLECFDSSAGQIANQASKERLSTNKTQAGLALKALRRLNGATEMGVSMRDYGQLALDQISNIDDALREMSDGELKTAITNSREAYVDARALWSSMVSSQFVMLFVQNSKETYSKYSIDKKYLATIESAGLSARSSDMNMSIILNPVWAAGKSALARAEQLAGDGKF